MMEEGTNKDHRHEGCRCNGVCREGFDANGCIGCWVSRRRLLKIVFVLVLLGFVFWLGLMLGELKSILRGEGFSGSFMYRHGSMMSPYNNRGSYYGNGGMMNSEWDTDPNAPSSSATPQ